jgi:two-component system, NarL family, nitrate/nitrite response regulator NarL
MNTNKQLVRVLLSDASMMGCELLADGLRRARFEVAGCCYTSEHVLRLVTETNPDVVLVSADLQDARLGGFKILTEIRRRSPQTRPIMLMDERERELVISAFRGGAKGVFFRHQQPFGSLCKCIRAVNNGQVWASSQDLEYTLEALAEVAPLREVDPTAARSLTKREEQMISLVAQGLTNREIAQKVFLSEHTVKNYLFRIFEKLNVSSRVELILFATRLRESSNVKRTTEEMFIPRSTNEVA